MLKTVFRGVLLLACLLAGHLAGAQEQVAMLTDVEGQVRLAGEPGSGRLAILSDIRKDAQVQLDQGARMVAVYLKSGQEYECKGPALLRFTANQLESLSGNAPQLRGVVLSQSGGNVRIKPVRVIQAAVVMRDAKMAKPPSFALSMSTKIRMLGFDDTAILETNPVFNWQGVHPKATYQFTLLDAKGQAIVDQRVDKTSVSLPEKIRLQEGAEYRWQVKSKSGDGLEYSGEGSFRVASAAVREEVEKLRPAPEAPFADRVAFAAWLTQMELRDEARKLWKALSVERPDDRNLKSLAADKRPQLD